MRDSDWRIITELRRQQNITKAAEALYMTQPTLTKRLQQMERELGIRIVERSTKGVFFTPQGEYLAEQAERISGLIDYAKTHLECMKSGDSGTLRIGAANSFVRFALPETLKRYQQLYPKVAFSITTSLSTDIVKRVKSRELQVGFIRGDCPFDGERYLVSQEHAFIAYQRALSVEELPLLPQVNYFKDGYSSRLIEDWWNSWFSRPPLIGMQVNHGDTCKSMVAQGLGYGVFLVDGYVKPEDGLVKSYLYTKTGEPVLRNTWMIYEREEGEKPLVQNFLSFIRERR